MEAYLLTTRAGLWDRAWVAWSEGPHCPPGASSSIPVALALQAPEQPHPFSLILADGGGPEPPIWALSRA